MQQDTAACHTFIIDDVTISMKYRRYNSSTCWMEYTVFYTSHDQVRLELNGTS